METTNLKIWLPFDKSATADLCGNTWTVHGTPIIQDGALYLDGASYLQLQGGLDLGGQDFTIRLYVNANDSGTAIYLYNDEIEDGLFLNYLPQGLNHIELDYVQAEQMFYMFVNGVLSTSMEWDIFATRRNYNLILGFSEYETDYFSGTIDDFIVYDGTALHTEDFTPSDDTDSNSDKLIVHLPFDESTTQDLCGNKWTAYGEPVIGTDGAVSGKSLQLTNGQYLELDETITIGGQDFTICGYCNFSSSSGSYARIFEMAQTSEKYTNVLFFGRYLRGANFVCAPNYNMSSGAGIWNERFQFIIAYNHAKSTLQWYLNDELKNTVTEITIARVARKLRLGSSLGNATGNFIGTIDDFKIYDGVALLDDTEEKPWTKEISQSYDVLFHITTTNPWKYYNLGTADDLLTSNCETLNDLPKTKSKTGTAFFQGSRAKCFNIYASNEIWMKFDVYNGYLWRAGNAPFGATPFYGIGSMGYDNGSNEALGFYASGYIRDYYVLNDHALQTILLHMKSGETDGIIEAWIDGNFIDRYTGNVNNGNLFDNIFLHAGSHLAFFSNVIVSNVQIGFEEGWLEFFPDVEFLAGMLVEFTADVVRNVRAKINLFPIDSTDFLAEKSSPTLKAPALKTASQNTQGIRSFEVNISEQQITEQISFAGIIPFDILQKVNGQYLDYHFDMRVEKVQQEGIIYRCECCSDLDKLLFTQLAYKIPPSTWRKVGADDTTVEIQTYYPPATAHVQKIAAALGLTPVMQFDNFLSTVLMDDLGGVTYNDLIRDVFGWSSRIPHKLINCYIRDGKLFVVQRGHESHLIDISDAKKTMPVVTKELVRTTWGSTPWSKTQTTEFQHTSWQAGVPDDVTLGGGSSDTGGGSTVPSGDDDEEEEQVREVSTQFSGHDYQGYTTYTYDRKGLLVQTYTHVEKDINGSLQITNTTVEHGYDDDNTMIYTSTFVQSYGVEGESSSKSIEEKGYVILPNGEKFLAWEHSATYQNDDGLTPTDSDLVDSKVTVHSPSRVGQSHTITIDTDGEIIGSAAGQNTGDDRVTPFSKYNSAMLGKKLFASNSSIISGGGSSSGQWVTDTETYELINNGLSLYDSSFPIHDEATLIKVTQALRWLNRKTQETLLITLYEFPHLIDFNDRIIFNGNEYFLVNNTGMTTPRILNEQKLTLRRWY